MVVLSSCIQTLVQYTIAVQISRPALPKCVNILRATILVLIV